MLIRQLHVPSAAPAAAKQLGMLNDLRSIAPLLQSMVYGDPQVQHTATEALNQLATQPSLLSEITRHANTNPDQAIRAAAARILPDASQPVAPTTINQAVTTRSVVKDDNGTISVAEKKTSPKPADRDRSRLVYSPTALIREKGQWNWTFHNIALWDIGYGLSDNVEVSVQTVPPIGLLAALPRVKAGFTLQDNIHLALNVTGGFLMPYIGGTDDVFGVIGAGPIMTIGDERLLINLGAPFYSFFAGSDALHLMAPNIGFGVQFSKHAKFNAEVHVPVVLNQDFDDNGKYWILLYGLRFSGERLYGDVSFILPITPYIDNYIAYMPIGAPLVSFGVTW